MFGVMLKNAIANIIKRTESRDRLRIVIEEMSDYSDSPIFRRFFPYDVFSSKPSWSSNMNLNDDQLVDKLYAIEGVNKVFPDLQGIVVRIDTESQWRMVEPEVIRLIEFHLGSSRSTKIKKVSSNRYIGPYANQLVYFSKHEQG